MSTVTTSNASLAEGETPQINRSLGEVSEDVLGTLMELNGRFGPIAAVQDGGQRVIFSFDPTYNKQILSDATTFEARFFAVRGPKKSSQRRVTCGLLGMNGQQHRRNRRMLKEPFGLKQIATYKPAIKEMADELVAGWKLGTEIDLNEEMIRFMLQVTSSILFGMSHSEEERQLAYEVGEQIAEWGKLNHEVGVGALVPNDTFSERYEELLKFSEGLEAQVMEMINKRRCADAQGKELGNDVLSILVRMHDADGGLSDEELVGQSCVLFGAAHLTTAHSLTWTSFLLAQHPEYMQSVVEELQADDWPEVGTPGASKLDRVIREGMRLLPASSYSQRINTESVDIGPFKSVPRGTPIVFSPFITHHLESIYKDAYAFNPDRWLTLKTSTYEYLPFGAGPRMCIGGPLAMEVIRISMPIFLKAAKMTVVPGSDISAQIRSTMLNPVNGMPMRLDSHDGNFQSSPVTGNVHNLVRLPEACRS